MWNTVYLFNVLIYILYYLCFFSLSEINDNDNNQEIDPANEQSELKEGKPSDDIDSDATTDAELEADIPDEKSNEEIANEENPPPLSPSIETNELSNNQNENVKPGTSNGKEVFVLCGLVFNIGNWPSG